MIKKKEELEQDFFEPPKITDRDWNEYVLSHFGPDELADGNPTVDGLRRVAELLLGPIVVGEAKVIQSPNPQNDSRCVVEYTCTIKTNYGDITQRSAADCYPGNCDHRFAVYSSAIAETRAEGRSLRKLLKLRKVIAAEEAGLVPLEETGVNGKITPTQMNFIETLCKRNDINVVAYLGGAKDFNFNGKLEEIPYKSAVAVISHLSEMQRQQSSINVKFKGYNPNWRS